jgi:uracil DNA glycosylase
MLVKQIAVTAAVHQGVMQVPSMHVVKRLLLLSSVQGFSGCNHFSKTNQLLQQSGQAAIDWRIS